MQGILKGTLFWPDCASSTKFPRKRALLKILDKSKLDQQREYVNSKLEDLPQRGREGKSQCSILDTDDSVAAYVFQHTAD